MSQPPVTSGSSRRPVALPEVAGVIGPLGSASAAVDGIAAAAFTDLRPVARLRHAAVWAAIPAATSTTATPTSAAADAPISVWPPHHAHGGPDETLITWHPLFPARRPRSWRDAANQTGAAGLVAGPDGARLFGSAWGVHPLYVRRVGDFLAFATTIHRLLDVTDGPLHADWDAWACVFSLNFPVGTLTPFAEVSRVAPGGSWRYDARRRTFDHDRELPTAAAAEQPSAKAGDVAEAIAQAVADSVPDVSDAASVTLTLSGGWDSRLLAAIATDLWGAAAVRSLTTPKHRVNVDPDVELSRSVAVALGLKQEIVTPDAARFPEYARAAFARMEHQTWEHSWLEPVAATARRWGRPVLDGLAADVLLKNNSVTPEAVAARNHHDVGAALWRRLARPPKAGLPLIDAAAAGEIGRRALEAFDTDRLSLAGHPDEARLTVLRARTARGVSLSPFGLFAPEVRVCVPFLAHEFVTRALSVPADAKSDGGFYRQVLTAAAPRVAQLPSTNDPDSPAAAGPFRHRSEAALAWSRQSVDALRSRCPGLPAVPDDVLFAPRADNWRQLLLLFDSWLDRYGSRLASCRPPWWERARP